MTRAAGAAHDRRTPSKPPSKPPGRRATPITPATGGEAREAIEATLDALDRATLRVAEKRGPTGM
jgi:hypothetical protein